MPAQNRVGRAQRFFLVADVAGRPQPLGHREQVLFRGFPEVAGDKHDVVDPVVRGADDVLDEAFDNGFAGDGDERFGRGQGVGSQSAATSCHRYDDVHFT